MEGLLQKSLMAAAALAIALGAWIGGARAAERVSAIPDRPATALAPAFVAGNP